MRRVVVTGIGAITPVGCDVDTFWNSLLEGRCGIDFISKFDTSDLQAKLAAEVKDFDAKKYFETPGEIRRTDDYIKFAVAAAEQAVEDSKIKESDIDATRFGCYLGSGMGGMGTFLSEADKLRARGVDRVSPFFIPMSIANMATGMVAIRHGAKGPSLPIVTACATSSNAVGEAYRTIKHGYADAIIAGGSEASINELAVAGFVNCKALSLSQDPNAASLPFDARRGGFVMGEGAAVLILEEYDRAVARGANIYAEVVGYGNTCDAYHITSPDPDAEGAINAIRLAKEEAGMTGDNQIYVNAHGTGTHMNDAMETTALKAVFGDDAYKLHISSTKSVTGHMLGAAGAIEAIASVLALKNGVVPPTINYKEKDEELDLDYTPNTPVKADLEYALSSSLGFGGHNACIALKRIDA